MIRKKETEDTEKRKANDNGNVGEDAIKTGAAKRNVTQDDGKGLGPERKYVRTYVRTYGMALREMHYRMFYS